jgi:hypothetical protein
MSFWKKLFGGSKPPQPTNKPQPVQAPPPPLTPKPSAEKVNASDIHSEDKRKAMYAEINKVLYDIDAMVADTMAGFSSAAITDRAADRAAKHLMRSYGLSLAEIQSLMAEGSSKNWPGPK